MEAERNLELGIRFIKRALRNTNKLCIKTHQPPAPDYKLLKVSIVDKANGKAQSPAQVWIALQGSTGPVGIVILPNVAMGEREKQWSDQYEVITISKSWICSLKWGVIGPEIARTSSPYRSHRLTNRQGAPHVNWISDFFGFFHVFHLFHVFPHWSPFRRRSCPLGIT